MRRSSLVRDSVRNDDNDDDTLIPVDLLRDVVLLNRSWVPGDRLLLEGNRMELYSHIDDCLLIGSNEAPVAGAAWQPRFGALALMLFVMLAMVLQAEENLRPHSWLAWLWLGFELALAWLQLLAWL